MGTLEYVVQTLSLSYHIPALLHSSKGKGHTIARALQESPPDLSTSFRTESWVICVSQSGSALQVEHETTFKKSDFTDNTQIHSRRDHTMILLPFERRRVRIHGLWLRAIRPLPICIPPWVPIVGVIHSLFLLLHRLYPC